MYRTAKLSNARGFGFGEAAGALRFGGSGGTCSSVSGNLLIDLGAVSSLAPDDGPALAWHFVVIRLCNCGVGSVCGLQ